MNGGEIFKRGTAKRLGPVVSWVEQHMAASPPSGMAKVPMFGRDPLRIVKTTETISPNTFGGFKFTTGAKGSEAVTGDEYQGFYRASDSTDPPDLPIATLCYAIWVPCDTLTGDQTGWELTPVACIEEA